MSLNTRKYDAIVIGTGQGGKPLATALASAGWKIAVIEGKYVGGTCVNFGCTPTKSMVASARIAYLAKRASEFGVNISSVSVDLKKIRKRKQEIVNSFRQGGQHGLENMKNLDLIFGKAHFKSSHQIEISLPAGKIRNIESDKIIINTGAKPFIPNIPGLAESPFLDSTGIMELEEVPEHLIVMGGGYIGLEFGQMFRRFGSRVTIIQKGKQLLSREDADVAEAVANILKEDGIEIFLNTNVTRSEKLSNRKVKITVEREGDSINFTGSHLLVSAGRIANTTELQLEKTAVQVDNKGNITTNEFLETNVRGIYAIGDVKGGPAFTHISYDDFRILKANLLYGKRASIKGRMVPYTVFIDPELGRVGLSEKEAKSRGFHFQVAKLPMTHVARAIEKGETRGLMKAIVDAETHQILGCAILGIEGGEIMSVLQMAMMGQVPYTEIKDGIFAHPTLSESLNNLFMNMYKS